MVPTIIFVDVSLRRLLPSGNTVNKFPSVPIKAILPATSPFRLDIPWSSKYVPYDCVGPRPMPVSRLDVLSAQATHETNTMIVAKNRRNTFPIYIPQNLIMGLLVTFLPSHNEKLAGMGPIIDMV